MITTGFGYVSFLICFLAAAFWFTNKYPWKIFDVIPAIIIVYIGSAVLASFKFYAANDSVGAAQTLITRQFLPMAIILLLMICNFKSIMQLGPKLLGAFFLSSIISTRDFRVNKKEGLNRTPGAPETGSIKNYPLSVKQRFLLPGN